MERAVRLFDGVRKRLGSTPLGKRLWTWWDHRQTQVFLLSYPKTGRTWLRLMIGKSIVEGLCLDADLLDIGQLYRFHRRVPRMRVMHDDRPQLKRPHELERHKHQFRNKRVILLVRDPRDTVISNYFQATRRDRHFSGTASEFLRHPIGSLDTIIEYHNVWADNRNVPETLCLVRYEDLHTDPAGQLRRVLTVIGYVPPEPAIQRAVEYSRFENVRALEQSGRLSHKQWLRPGDADDPESFKTRKGKVGGFYEYLTPDEISYMNERIADRLSPFYEDYRRPQ